MNITTTPDPATLSIPPEPSPLYAPSPAESVEQLESEPEEKPKKAGPEHPAPPAPSTPTATSDSHPIRSDSLKAPTASNLLSPTTPASPAKRRPAPPTKGILKPPPPPPKPTLGNRLRDLAANVVGGTGSSPGRILFDADDTSAGPSTSNGLGLGLGGTGGPGSGSPGSVSAAVGGTLNALGGALGGRIGAGLSRFVGGSGGSPGNTPTASPLRSVIGLPEVITTPPPMSTQPVSEKARQKQPLRRATFVLPSLSITYPISSQGEPWSVKVIEDRQRIESSHKSLLSHRTGAKYWTAPMLVKLYESACKGREEKPREGIIRALEAIPAPPHPRQIHLQLGSASTDTSTSAASSSSSSTNLLDTPLNRHSAEAFSDVLSSEWSLSDLRLENGLIEDELALKPILHALLVSGTLGNLSLAGNRKLRDRSWRLLAVFLKRARSLRYVDLSETNWDRRSIEYLVQALTGTSVRPRPSSSAGPAVPVPEKSNGTAQVQDQAREAGEGVDIDGGQEAEGEATLMQDVYGSFIPHAPLLRDGIDGETSRSGAGVQTLRMDGCGLRANLLESLASGVRSSDIKNISLRRNRIGPLGAVALALMIRDYPDSTPLPIPHHSSASSANPEFGPGSGSSGTGYNPYAARSRRINGNVNGSPSLRGSPAAHPSTAGSDDNLPPIPLIVSNSPGVTSQTLPEGYRQSPQSHFTAASASAPTPPPKHPLHPLFSPPSNISSSTQTHDSPLAATLASVEGKMSGPDVGGASIALQRQVRALDGVERIGRVLTLDLKGNEIRNGVTYIAQVLKRNRTLKVLNLSDNRIDSSGLAALAEALKYNSTLETLDLSNNPCCGPGLEGVTALRTAFTVNTSLKRLFLSETNLSSDGAIALAEFLPESKSLLHLDLTSNPLDVAGILALSSGLKRNTLIRCLDVSIAPNQPDLADLSQSILLTCIRNTEIAAGNASKGNGRGGEAIWAPIKKSVLVRQAKEAEDFRAQQERVDIASSPEGLAREFVYKLTPDRLIPICESTGLDLERWLTAGKIAKMPGFHAWEPNQLPKEDWRALVERAKALRERLVDEVSRSEDEGRLARMLELNDSLGAVLHSGRKFTPPPRLLLPSQIVAAIIPPNPTTPRESPGIDRRSSLLGKGMPQSSSPSASSPSIARHRRHMRGTSLEISSPNFSIGDSDNDSDADAEELDMVVGGGKLPSTPQPTLPKDYPGPGRINTSSGASKIEAMDDIEAALREAAITSPVERVGKAWMEEEGEVFRKGTKLGVADDEEVEEHGDVSGEDLRQEILDTEVARSPTRRRISIEDEDADTAEPGEGESKGE